jgi:CheY-like chemotaxis protein
LQNVVSGPFANPNTVSSFISPFRGALLSAFPVILWSLIHSFANGVKTPLFALCSQPIFPLMDTLTVAAQTARARDINAAKRITVLLAEDNETVRQGLRDLLDAEDDLEVVGEAQNGRQAVALTRKLRPAVVLMDIAMPVLNGLDATRQIAQAVPDTKVLILSAHSDDAYVDQASALGAAGYLLKQNSAGFLPAAIRKVQMGKTVFSPSIAKRARNHSLKSPGRGAHQRA